MIRWLQCASTNSTISEIAALPEILVGSGDWPCHDAAMEITERIAGNSRP
jgi:hypothetical protein